MKARSVFIFVFVVGLLLLSTWAVSAQGPKPGQTPVLVEPSVPQGYNSVSNAPVSSGLYEYKPLAQPPNSGPGKGARAPRTLGSPGSSLRYLQSFGTVQVPYIDDTTHLNLPYGVGTDGTNVWIADSNGMRALKYDASGAFLQQIGKAGFRYGVPNIDLDWVTDVAVDAGGNLWIVDGNVAQVFKLTSGGNLSSALGQAWTRGTANNLFNSPRGVAFDSGSNVYVSDGYNHRIQIFNSAGAYITTIGTSGTPGAGSTQFNLPGHIAIYADTLYVADCNNHRVQIFDAGHNYVATIGVTGGSGTDNSHFNCPTGVAVDAGRIYVADRNNQRVQIFDRLSLVYQNTLGTTGMQDSDNTHFRVPTDVTVDGAGNIYVADQYNARVQQFNSSLAYVRTYGTPGPMGSPGVAYLTDGAHFNQPSGITIAPDGSIYFTEARGQRLVKLNSAGAVQWAMTAWPGIPCVGTYCFNYPNDVALDSSGNVYVADSGNNRVQIYSPAGTYIATLGGSLGTGPYQFNYPTGIAIDSANNIYVADTYNHRIQIYNSSRVYLNTIGTGIAGSGNNQLNSPQDVAVDSMGNIYVADRSNHRVQIFNSSYAYVSTIGVTGVSGNDFDHLSNPIAVEPDRAGRVYVADQWGSRIIVFDSTGAFLTTIGSSGGNKTGQMRQVEGLAFDGQGNLYYADLNNHRLEKHAVGVPGWSQSNINGFGERANQLVSSLAPFNGQLYAGTLNYGGNGAQLWRLSPGSTWSPVITPGFGITRNVGIDHLFPFNNRLYAGTWADTVVGGQVWRSDDGTTWTQMILPGFDTTNGEVFRFAAFNNKIYASTWSYTNTHGVEIWRSDTGDSNSWTRVVSNGFNGNPNNVATTSLGVFNGFLYAGTFNHSTGGEVWRTGDGTTWNQVNTSGFGNALNITVNALQPFNGYLYAPGTNGIAGGWIQRCVVCDGSDWSPIVTGGFGNANNRGVESMVVLNNILYAGTANTTTGMEIWRSSDGTTWSKMSSGGFGNSNNASGYWNNAATVFNNKLYYGTSNWPNGGQVWRTAELLYLPMILR